jgi:hypothetical protein
LIFFKRRLNDHFLPKILIFCQKMLIFGKNNIFLQFFEHLIYRLAETYQWIWDTAQKKESCQR